MIAPSYFLNLASSANMQFLLDSSRLTLEMQSVWRQYLDVAPTQMSLTFDAAIGRERISAAASIVDTDSPSPLRTRQKLELYKGNIPCIKEKFRMSQDDMRNLEVMKNLPMYAGKEAELIKFLANDLQECSVSGDKRIDFMTLQAISTLTINIDVTNNPDGAVFGVIDLLAASYQKQGVPVIWSDAVNAKPITDIENFVQKNWASRGRMFGKLLISYDLWINIKKNAEVRSLLQGFYNTGKNVGSFAVTLDNVNEMMVANNWPTFEIIRHKTHIENDGKITYLDPFDVNACAFVPDGKLGKLFNALSMEELHPSAQKSYAKFGKTLVSKWSETDPLVEFTGMEMLAFPALDIDRIYVLTTNVVQASFV
jgi:hypothetical protein